jgi:hypothetical protein
MRPELFAMWKAGGDTSRPLPAGVRPWVDGSKVSESCPVQDCGSLLFDWSVTEVKARLDSHLQRRHGAVR